MECSGLKARGALGRGLGINNGYKAQLIFTSRAYHYCIGQDETRKGTPLIRHSALK